ncbi:MAG: leucine-rich repeat domain-containing protein, partial [Clostridia bacterium]|nr:leucine-rich repeat domain-containing protein [Clostridia bacterium]
MATMNEQKFYELFGEIDPEIIAAADSPVPFRQKRGFKIMLIAATLALVMLVTPIAGALVMVGSYKASHPDFEGGPIKVIDRVLEDKGIDLSEMGSNGLLNINWAAIPEVISPEGKINWGALGSMFRGDDPSETIGVLDYTSVKLTDGTMMITGYSGNEETVTVPDEIDGVPVTVIGEGAFAQNPTVEHVILPDSVTTIQREAFASCSNLILVKIPQNLQEIGDYAFSDCVSLSELYTDWSSSTYTGANLPYSLHTLGTQAFFNCQSLTMVVVRPTLASWGVNTFMGSGLQSVALMDGVTQIPDNAFAGTRLTEVVIP